MCPVYPHQLHHFPWPSPLAPFCCNHRNFLNHITRTFTCCTTSFAYSPLHFCTKSLPAHPSIAPHHTTSTSGSTSLALHQTAAQYSLHIISPFEMAAKTPSVQNTYDQALLLTLHHLHLHYLPFPVSSDNLGRFAESCMVDGWALSSLPSLPRALPNSSLLLSSVLSGRRPNKLDLDVVILVLSVREELPLLLLDWSFPCKSSSWICFYINEIYTKQSSFKRKRSMKTNISGPVLWFTNNLVIMIIIKMWFSMWWSNSVSNSNLPVLFSLL